VKERPARKRRQGHGNSAAALLAEKKTDKTKVVLVFFLMSMSLLPV